MSDCCSYIREKVRENMIFGFLSALAEFISIQGMCSIREQVIRYNLVWGSLRSIHLDFKYDYFMRLFEFLVGE